MGKIQQIACLAVALCAAVGSVWAQKSPRPMNPKSMNIRERSVTTSDLVGVLGAMDIKIYSFDLSQMAQTPLQMEVYVDSHRGDSVETMITIPVKRNIKYVDDFREEDRAEIRKKYGLKNNEQVLSRIEELKLVLLPKNDSVVKLRVDIPTYGTMTRELKLHQVVTPHYKTYFYSDRPFQLAPMVVGKQSPLVLYGSGWFDPNANIVRMCGESQIDPDLSKNEILGRVPQYYVIGVRFTAIKE